LQVIHAATGFQIQEAMLRVGHQQSASLQCTHDATAEGIKQLGKRLTGGAPGTVEDRLTGSKSVSTVDEFFNVFDKTGPGMTNYKP